MDEAARQEKLVRFKAIDKCWHILADHVTHEWTSRVLHEGTLTQIHHYILEELERLNG